MEGILTAIPANIIEYYPDFATFIYQDKPYQIEYAEGEILEIAGKQEHYSDVTGRTEYFNPTWENINKSHIVDYIINNVKSWKE